MTRRIVLAQLRSPAWSPPGISTSRWRYALAEDAADLLIRVAVADTGLCVAPSDCGIAAAVRWPAMKVYECGTPWSALVAAAADRYEQAAIIAGDAPDLPGFLLAKLMQPLDSGDVVVAPALGGGLLGVATQLPPPEWFSIMDDPHALDTMDAAAISAAAPPGSSVGAGQAWHRLRGPHDLRYLDPALDGWDATRTLLTGA